jgi:hypothetical protein
MIVGLLHGTLRVIPGTEISSIIASLSFFLFLNHLNGLGRAFFGTNSATFAIIHIYFDGYGPLDHPLGAIQPANKT